MRPGKFEIITGKVVALSDSSGAGLSLGATCGDRGKDRGSLQVSWPPRSALGVGLGATSANAELSLLCYGHGRCYKPSLTVEEVRGEGRVGKRASVGPCVCCRLGFQLSGVCLATGSHRQPTPTVASTPQPVVVCCVRDS